MGCLGRLTLWAAERMLESETHQIHRRALCFHDFGKLFDDNLKKRAPVFKELLLPDSGVRHLWSGHRVQ